MRARRGWNSSEGYWCVRGKEEEAGMFCWRCSVRLLCPFGRSLFVGVSAIEVGDKFWSMFQMLHGFPGAVTCGKTFQLHWVGEFGPLIFLADFLYFFGFVL